jgi:membrane fusion protein (multidrug efflux system)
MKWKVVVAILLVLGIGGGLGLIKMLQFRKMIAAAKSAPAHAETVSSAVVREENWQSTLNAIASVAAARGVTVTPDIPGTVRQIAFESGAVVAEGDLLVKLDTSTEEAELRAVEAQVSLAKVNEERVRTLRSQNMVSQSDLDQAEATLKQQEANADSIRATIAKKTIRAPFAGRLGIRQVNLGQYLEAGKSIVALQSLTPVYADFSLPQQELALLKTGMTVRLTTDTYPGRSFEGKLTAITPGLSETTRSVALQATFDNEDQLLRPGMFARAEVLLPEEKPVLVIPATSVLSAPYGDSVYVLETNPTNNTLFARQQFIRSGSARGDFLAVETGLTAGQQIASAGVFKLRNNMPVVINNDVQPKASQAPRPPNS